MVSGELPPLVRREDPASSIAIASSTGALVQTERERLRAVHAWKTNLLRQKAPGQSAPVLDPMIIPRHYSEEELSAIFVPAQKMTTTRGGAPLPALSVPGLGETSVATVSVLQGIETALELESELNEKMKQSLTSSEDLQAVQTLPPGKTYKPLTSLVEQQAAGAAPFTPMDLALASPTIVPSALSLKISDHAAVEDRPISPSERNAVLRRYKIGLSPIQKIKNMLDDLTSRQQ